MSKHTPGPWTLETVRTSVGWCHKVGPFPWKNGKENHACVYDDYASGHNGTPELIANARLISAAPDLLEALEASNLLLRTQRHACESNEVCRVLDVHISRNNAAIAKAKGESA